MDYQKYLDRAEEDLRTLWPDSLIIRNGPGVVEVYKDRILHGYVFRYSDDVLAVETNYLGAKDTIKIKDTNYLDKNGVLEIINKSSRRAFLEHLREELNSLGVSLSISNELMSVYLPEHQLHIFAGEDGVDIELMMGAEVIETIDTKELNNWKEICQEILKYIINYE